jgi:protein phosphatase
MLDSNLQIGGNHWHPEIAGGTVMNWSHGMNTDAYYPLATPSPDGNEIDIPGLAIVCDGMSGMMVDQSFGISQMAIRLLTEYISLLLTDLKLKHNNAIISPDTVMQAIESIFHQVSHDIATQNQVQKNYGTSVVLALHLAKPMNSSTDTPHTAHDIYIAHVGRCRAYWMTSDSCQQLTLDDDFTKQEVSMGRSTYEEMLDHPFAHVLTQLLGIWLDRLQPNLQKFTVEKNGILMLCSKGLSDNDLVQQSWLTFTQRILQGHISLQEAVQAWLDLANEKNGHANSSIVLMKFHIWNHD